ncbi:MAG: hypothetical protein L0Y55_16075 [Anaerolineales bacterium]|nr:hypothetical protein [Anaerolineales bacterium]
MSSTKEMTVEQLAKALVRLSPKQRASLVEILDRENLKARRALVHRQIAKGQIVTEKELFRNLN